MEQEVYIFHPVYLTLKHTADHSMHVHEALSNRLLRTHRLNANVQTFVGKWEDRDKFFQEVRRYVQMLINKHGGGLVMSDFTINYSCERLNNGFAYVSDTIISSEKL